MLTFLLVTHDPHHFPIVPPADDDERVSPGLEAQGVDELSAETFRAFIATGRLHARLISRLIDVGEGVHPGQFFCLRAVTGHDGISQRELADELHVAPPSVSRMVQNMERAGLVERRDDERDQRITRVYMTERGREFEAKFRTVAAGYVKDTIGRLPEADRRELIRLLKAFGDTIRSAIEARDGAFGPAAGDAAASTDTDEVDP